MNLIKKFFNFGMINVYYLFLCEILFLIYIFSESEPALGAAIFGVGVHFPFFYILMSLNERRKKRKFTKDLSVLLKLKEFLEDDLRTKVGNPMERWFPLGLFLILPFQIFQNGITFFMYKTGLIIVCITVGWFYITGVVIGYLDLYETESSHEVDSISENTKSKEE